MTIVLHHYAKSSASYRVRIALNLKGVDYERRDVDLVSDDQKSAGYRAANPQALVPMLEIDGHRLNQSLAICDYLDARFEQPPLVPRGPAERSHVLALALAVACEMQPLSNLRVRRYLADKLALSAEQAEAWNRHWLDDGLAALEALAAPRAGAWLFADTPSLADICLVPQLFVARRFRVPLDPYPTLLRAEATALAHPAFTAAHPDRQES